VDQYRPDRALEALPMAEFVDSVTVDIVGYV
jgi:hypothetical protein